MHLNKKPKLFNTNIIVLVCLVIIPTMLIFLTLSQKIKNEIITQNIKIETDSLSQIEYNIAAEIKNNTIMASAIVHDEQLIDSSINLEKAMTKSENYQSRKNLDKLLNFYLINNNFSGEIYLVFDKTKQIHLSRNTTCLDATYETINSITQETNSLIKKTQIVDNFYYKLGSSNPYNLVIVTYPPLYWGYKKSYSKEVLVTRLESIKKIYETDNKESTTKLLIVNSNNIIIASNETDLLNTKYDKASLENTDSIILSKNIENTNWKVVKIIDSNTITANVDKIIKASILSFALLLILYITYSIILIMFITIPIKQLINNMKEVGKGKYKKKKYDAHFKELEELSNSFNVMVDELEELNKQIILAHNETMLQEIEALRFQINPHFMCNSLGSIRMMAMLAKNDAIKRMSTALMIIMEDNLNGVGSFSSISHELKNIESYIYIMQVRYGDSFNFKKVIDNSCIDSEIPSMLLQPLIENSIIHGIRDIDWEGTIELNIKKINSLIVITIKDNGIGTNSIDLNKLFDDKTHTRGLNHIGLRNVKRRLELLYPNIGKIEITSTDKKGSSYFEEVITLPYKKLSNENKVIINRRRDE